MCIFVTDSHVAHMKQLKHRVSKVFFIIIINI